MKMLKKVPKEVPNKICKINSDKIGCNQIDKPKGITITSTKSDTKPSTQKKIQMIITKKIVIIMVINNI